MGPGRHPRVPFERCLWTLVPSYIIPTPFLFIPRLGRGGCPARADTSRSKPRCVGPGRHPRGPFERCLWTLVPRHCKKRTMASRAASLENYNFTQTSTTSPASSHGYRRAGALVDMQGETGHPRIPAGPHAPPLPRNCPAGLGRGNCGHARRDRTPEDTCRAPRTAPST